MFLLLAICIIIFLTMIFGILFFPKIKIGKISLDSYWVITLLGALFLILIKKGDFVSIFNSLIADTAINPIKILVLFISMTILSIFLDEEGFFKYLANFTLSKAGKSQTKLFLYLYLTVSVLTVFTSNDIIILSFTPFICYFCKSAKINPLPYLAAEFVGANTWSMALIIGNPTNIYLATAFGIDFINYLKIMILPTLVSGTISFIILFLLFRKDLKKEIEKDLESNVQSPIKDKVNLIIGIIHLGACTLMLALSSLIKIEMWLVSMIAVISLIFFVLIFSLIRKRKPKDLVNSFSRAPWQLIPFIISMFAIIVMMSNSGITNKIANLFGEKGIILKYGLSSFFVANVINNIPMSVLYCSIIDNIAVVNTGAVFATIIGSNLGALFTPIGALAGIMWSSILNKHGIKFGYFNFLKIGVIVAIPSILSCLGILALII
ncbi:MAG: hypothetical protein MJ066_00465 [Clostridia bacterium]|nr:hypothetical protein [Clostridia bacterium]